MKHDEWVTHTVVLNFETFYMLLKNLEYILDNNKLNFKDLMQKTRLPPSLRPKSHQLRSNLLYLISHCLRLLLRSIYLELNCWFLVLFPDPILIESKQLVRRVYRHIGVGFRETVEPFSTRNSVELEATSRQARENVGP